jgi:hypothetical protein
MNDEILRILAHERQVARLREAQHERLAPQLRTTRLPRSSRRPSAAMLGHLLVVRRHAAQ